MNKGTIIRTAVLVIALVNQVLVASGLTPIPGTEDQWGEIASTVFTFVAAAVAWFKNNYVTAKGKAQKGELEKKGLD